jgi:hypothetical protein
MRFLFIFLTFLVLWIVIVGSILIGKKGGKIHDFGTLLYNRYKAGFGFMSILLVVVAIKLCYSFYKDYKRDLRNDELNEIIQHPKVNDIYVIYTDAGFSPIKLKNIQKDTLVFLLCGDFYTAYDMVDTPKIIAKVDSCIPHAIDYFILKKDLAKAAYEPVDLIFDIVDSTSSSSTIPYIIRNTKIIPSL